MKTINPPIRKHWPLFAAIGTMWIIVAVLVAVSINRNQSHLIYPLDDTYIHMAIAKNFVLHHVWGVTEYKFTSSTSSPLWTFLLALTYFIFGVNELSPLILNLFFGTLAIVIAYFFLQKLAVHPARLTTFIILFVAIAATPLPTLIVIGMEHSLHALLMLCFVYLSVSVLSARTSDNGNKFKLLAVLAPLVTSCRYEGLFAAFAVCVLCIMQKRVLSAVVLGAAAILPVVIYGIVSAAHGWYFFPNSVLLKGQVHLLSLHGIFKPPRFGALSELISNAPLCLLFVASLVLLVVQYGKKGVKDPVDNYRQHTALIFIMTLLLHAQFAQTGWFYRYEAYLVLCGIIGIGMPAGELLFTTFARKFSNHKLPYFTAVIILIVALSVPFCRRATASLLHTPQAANNVYEQQYQMGRFIKQFYQGETVAVNDIGAVTYLADFHLFDLWGIGSFETARLKLHNRYTAMELDSLFRKERVSIAIFYDSMLFEEIEGRFPQWIRVGQWEIPNNVIAGDSIVSHYAVDSSACHELTDNLRRFAKQIPADVKQTGLYTEP